MRATTPHPDPAAYRLAQILFRAPSVWYQTATAFPLLSSATCGLGLPALPKSPVSRTVAVRHPPAGAAAAHGAKSGSATSNRKTPLVMAVRNLPFGSPAP